MSYYKGKFSSYTNDYLLSMRAMGDELADDAHFAIEEIFQERGSTLPPRPANSVIAESPRSAKTIEYFKLAGSTTVFLLGIAAAQIFVATWVGVILAIAAAIYYLAQKISFNPEFDAESLAAKKVKEENFSELMLESADGNLARVVDLLNYSTNIDQQSKSGYTALMLALRNNQVGIVEALLNAGADVRLRTTQGTSALDVARKNGNVVLIDLISAKQS